MSYNRFPLAYGKERGKAMIRKNMLLAKIALFAVVLPFVYGCQGGGGGGASLLGGGASGLSGGGSGGGETLAGGSGGLETIHNPEPASLLLLGGGMMAMAFWKNRIK